MKLVTCALCCLAACGFATCGFAAAAAAGGSTTQPAKLWASDLPAFLNQSPGHWIVARSQKPALSAQEAETLARSEAARAVVPILAGRLKRPIEQKVLASRVEASLFRDDWLVDRQIEATERPYGTIWSAAVLVDASPAKIDALVRQIEHQTRERHARAVAGLLALFVVTAIVGSFYAFLNWLTRGFFRGRLAIASILVVASAVLGVVHLL
jgi:hypothetical protein